MKLMIETFLTAFLFVFVSYVFLGFVSMNQQASTARSFHTACIDSIENNNYSTHTIDEWEEKAEDYGYTLHIENLSKLKVDEVVPCYYVSLSYPVKMGILGVNEESTIKGYAR